MGQSYFIAGRYRDAATVARTSERASCQRAGIRAAGNDGIRVLLLCYMMKAIVSAWLGEFDDSERCSEQASDLAEENDRPYDLIAASYGRGVVQMMRGNMDEAESALDQALRISRESEVRLFLPL